jgi:hypothetical protein
MGAYDFYKFRNKKRANSVWNVYALGKYLPKISGRPSLLQAFWKVHYDLNKYGLGRVIALSEITDTMEQVDEFFGDDVQYFPSDYWDAYERKKSKEVQNLRGDNLWGLEIGVRFIASKEHYPSVPCPGLAKLLESTFQQRYRDKDYNILSMSQKLEMILVGGPEVFLKNLKWAHKFWIFQTYEEFRYFWL